MRIAREKKLTLHPIITPSNASLPTMGMTYVTDLPISTQGDLRRTATINEASDKHTSGSVGSQGLMVPTGNVRAGAVPVTSLEQRTQMERHKPKRPAGGQLLRAYKLWHEEQLPLHGICSALRSPENPLAKSTVM